MKQQTLAPVQKTESDKVVVKESQRGPNYDICKAEASSSLDYCNLGAH